MTTLPDRLRCGGRLENRTVKRRGRPWLEGFALFFASMFRDAVVLYEPTRELFVLCALRWLFPFARARLIVVDLILARPGRSFRQRVSTIVKRLLLRRVDHYLLHIKDISGLQECYGVPPGRVRYIPFKVNSWDVVRQMDVPEGEYVFTGGRSRRDYCTFCHALGALGYPALLLTPRTEENREHETFWQPHNLPGNVRLVHDDGSPRSWIGHMARARLVVICIDPCSISASGIGTYLLAMALGKCVIVTESPATRGILTHEDTAVVVPMGDAAALARAVRRAWEDDAYRERIAARGQAYALGLGGEDNLRRNIAEAGAAFVRRAAA
jgi:hypothetical protein